MQQQENTCYKFKHINANLRGWLNSLQQINEFSELKALLSLLHNNPAFDPKTLEITLKEMKSVYTKRFITEAIPLMAKVALEILESQQLSIPYLLTNQQVELTRQHVMGILALAFFGLLETQQCNNWQFPPNISMKSLLYQGQKEKLKCILSYFIQCSDQLFPLTELVQYQKLKMSQDIFQNQQQVDVQNVTDCWLKSNIKLCDVEFTQNKNEDLANSIVVDFSDQYYSGKALACQGCAQEEILVMIYPETIVASFFVSRLLDDEAVMIMNALRFNDYSGYEDQFICKFIQYKNLHQTIVAIDAVDFRNKQNQYSNEAILRELNKALVGFQQGGVISTGKWGCGVYMGCKYLKTIIQWVASSQSNRDVRLIINCMNDKGLLNFKKTVNQLRNKYGIVGNMVKALLSAGNKHEFERILNII